jgi:hypothetical protein
MAMEGTYGEEEDEVQHVDAFWFGGQAPKPLSCFVQANSILFCTNRLLCLASTTVEFEELRVLLDFRHVEYARVMDGRNNDINHVIKRWSALAAY